MQLFQLVNYKVTFLPITMMIKEFSDIRDKNNDDDLTLKEISYVWYFTDVKSDFQNILDEKERSEEIKKRIALPKNWKPSKEVLAAIKFYKEYSRTPSSGLYESSVISAQFLEKKLKEPEKILAEVDDKGKPMYKLKDISDLIKSAPTIMKNLHDAKLQVIKEEEMQSELKANRVKAVFEDGDI